MMLMTTDMTAVRPWSLAICVLAFGVLCARAELRRWTHASGQSIEAEYVSLTLSDEVVLRNSDGNEVKVPVKELSDEDRDYLLLQNPPELTIEFSDSSRVDTLESSIRFQSNPSVTEEIIQFSLRIKQANRKDYPFELTVEYFAIGYQYLDQDKYVLITKGKDDFVLNEENNRSVELSSKEIHLPLEFTLETNHYGRKYCAYIVLITDQRGELIAYRSSKNWLFDHREALSELPVGAFFDDTCTRRHASQPKLYY